MPFDQQYLPVFIRNFPKFKTPTKQSKNKT